MGAEAAFFFLWCVLPCDVFVVVVVAEAAGASADIGAAVFGISAAIAPAARPMVNNAEIIKVPDLVIGSPTVGINKRMEEYDGSAELSPDEDHFTNRGSAPLRCALGVLEGDGRRSGRRVTACRATARRRHRNQPALDGITPSPRADMPKEVPDDDGIGNHDRSFTEVGSVDELPDFERNQ